MKDLSLVIELVTAVSEIQSILRMAEPNVLFLNTTAAQDSLLNLPAFGHGALVFWSSRQRNHIIIWLILAYLSRKCRSIHIRLCTSQVVREMLPVV